MGGRGAGRGRRGPAVLLDRHGRQSGGQQGARLWNRTNVLCLSLPSTSEALALEILHAWPKATACQPNAADGACLEEVQALEERYRRPPAGAHDRSSTG
jgi:hypothetical protein